MRKKERKLYSRGGNLILLQENIGFLKYQGVSESFRRQLQGVKCISVEKLSHSLIGYNF